MKETIKANLTTGKLKAFGKEIDISSHVRTEENGLRKKDEEPVLSIPESLPVMPQKFPAGLWQVYDPRERTSKELAPYFIPTSAYASLPVWSMVRENGKTRYGNKLGIYTIDRGYGLHFSEYVNTIGCIKIHRKKDLLWLVAQIQQALKDGIVMIEVTE